MTNTDDMFKAICNFIKKTTNGGVIQPSLGVFPSRQYGFHDFRIWNKFLLAYAGYIKEELVANPNGPGIINKITKIGDQGNVEFTKVGRYMFCLKYTIN
jgi:nitric oxide synthase oxygenase domain/subunit